MILNTMPQETKPEKLSDEELRRLIKISKHAMLYGASPETLARVLKQEKPMAAAKGKRRLSKAERSAALKRGWAAKRALKEGLKNQPRAEAAPVSATPRQTETQVKTAFPFGEAAPLRIPDSTPISLVLAGIMARLEKLEQSSLAQLPANPRLVGFNDLHANSYGVQGYRDPQPAMPPQLIALEQQIQDHIQWTRDYMDRQKQHIIETLGAR